MAASTGTDRPWTGHVETPRQTQSLGGVEEEEEEEVDQWRLLFFNLLQKRSHPHMYDEGCHDTQQLQ